MTTTMQEKEAKIDKRTKEYKDSQVPDIIGDIEEEPEPVPDDLAMEKLDVILGLLREIHRHITHPLVNVPVAPEKEPAMTPVKDLTKCMECGKDLPPVETPRIWPEACHDCVYKEV